MYSVDTHEFSEVVVMVICVDYYRLYLGQSSPRLLNRFCRGIYALEAAQMALSKRQGLPRCADRTWYVHHKTYKAHDYYMVFDFWTTFATNPMICWRLEKHHQTVQTGFVFYLCFSQVLANEGRRYKCNAFSYWLRLGYGTKRKWTQNRAKADNYIPLKHTHI